MNFSADNMVKKNGGKRPNILYILIDDVSFGKLPVNLNAQMYYNVEKPDGYGDYQARIRGQFMFPK